MDEAAQLVLSDADESAARKQILQLVNENAAEGEEREISSMLLLDIGFVSGGEPAAVNGLDPIRVTIKAAAIRSMSAPKLFHLSDGTAQEVKDVLFDSEAGTAVFTGITFSPFAVVDLTGEGPAEEAAEETVGVSMPAQSFTGETEGVIVSVEAPEGAFPEGTTMVVSTVEMDDETLSNVTGAVESSGEKKVVTAQAVDISFFDAEGTLIEPKLPIKVSMKSALVSESENVALVHLTEAAAADPAENAEAEATEAPAAPTAEVVTDVQVVENPDEHNEIQFESDAFSVYVLVGTETITTNYITADGETYTITVTYGPEAGIPVGAALAVAEIPRDSEEYAAYLAQAQSAVKAGAAAGGTEAAAEPAEVPEDAAETPAEAEAPAETDSAVETESAGSTGGTTDRVTVTTARFFDITILDAAGNPVEPAAPVDVKIAYMEPAETAENYQVVHFGEETEVLNPAVSGADGAASAFDFQASSFSVFGVVGMKIITMQYITADGETYIITVTYGPEAGIPEGSELVAREISSDEDMYRDYWDAAEEHLQDENDAAGISDARFFDVSIVSEGQKIEPKTAVEVKITQDEPVGLSEDGELCIIHFAAEGIEVINDLAVNEMATEITYLQNGFSVIGEVSVTNSSGWPVVNGKYVLVFQDTANSKYYALGKDKSLREVKVAGETIVFLGEGTTDVSYLDDYAWYLMGSGGDSRTRAYLSTEYYQGSGDAAQGGTYIDFNDNSGFSNSARQLYFSTDKNMIYSRYYYNEYTFSVSNGILSRVTTSNSNASPILFAQVDGFIANSSESDKFTQIDVDSLVTKFQRQMTQELIVDKTAKAQDYSNRIYKIEIGASSGYYEISPSIHLEFVVDASRSMFFPTSLDQAGTLNGNSRSNLETWLRDHGNTDQTYFVIADPNGAATVYTIFRRNGVWYYVDASNYNPPDGDVQQGRELNTWSVSNLDGYVYTTDITGSSSTNYGNRYKWVSRIEYLKQAVKAAAQVIYAVDTNAELGLVTFNSETFDKGTFTNDQAQEFYKALEEISLAGGTNQRDGLQEAINKFNADTQRTDHQCIALLITDGAPNWKVNGTQVPNSTAWTEIGQKASTLKALADGDGTAELYCLGLSLENVGTNKSSLFGVSSGTGYNYNAEDAAAIVDCITQIVKNVVLQANLVGQVTDVIDSAFYPVTSDGTPLADGDWITLNGEIVAAGNKDAAGQVKYDSSSDIWTVEWKDQKFDWPPKDSAGNIIGTGWKGVLYVKAKENFLGGNTISTNAAGSEIKAEKYVSRTGSEIDLTGEHTSDLSTPYVNVDELALTEANTEWTVYLGTEVNPKEQLEHLLQNIEIRKVVSDDTNEMITSNEQMLNGTSASSKTIKLTTYLGLDTNEKITALINVLLADGSKTYPYNSSEMTAAYGHGYVGDIVISLESTYGCYNKGNHATEAVGKDAEFTLKVEYTPKDQNTRNAELHITTNDYHTTSGGSAGDLTGNMSSSNHHVINVFAKGLQITKKDQSFTRALTGAEFTLYRTARTGDDQNNVTTLAGVTGEFFAVETYSVSNAGVMTIDPVEPLKENESYYLVETKAPAGHNLLTEAIPITLKIENSYTPISGGTPTTVKPEGAYNWIQRAALSMDTSNPLVQRVDSSGTNITNSHINAPTLDNETEKQYYEIANSSGVELPQTGGEGTLIFSVLGTILILSSTLLILAKRKQEAYTPRH